MLVDRTRALPMSAEPTCPSCQRPLPPSVTGGPPQAVLRCEGCAALLLWSNGKVVRTARSGSPTVAGMPAVKPPARADSPEEDITRVSGGEAEPPLSELKPEEERAPAKAVPPPRPVAPASQPRAGARKDPTPVPPRAPSKTVLGLPIPAAAPKREPSAPVAIKREPSAPVAVPKRPSAPVAVPKRPSAPVAIPPARSEPKKPETPSLIAQVATEAPAAPGPLVDPKAWFTEPPSATRSAPKGEPTGSREPSELAQPLPPPPAGPAPLPPPPKLDEVLPEPPPFRIDALGEELPPPAAKAPARAPVAPRAPAPAKPIATPPAQSRPAPAPRVGAAEPLPSGPTLIAPAPSSPSPIATSEAPPSRAPEAALPALATATGPAPSAPIEPSPSMVIGSAPSVAVEAPGAAVLGSEAIDELGLMIPKEPRFTRRQIFIALGGAALFVALVLGLALSGGKPKAKPPLEHAAIPARAPAPPAPTPPPTPPVQAAATPPAPVPTPTPAEAAVDPTPVAEAPHRHGRHLLGGKKVVLEYDPKPADPKPAVPEPAGEVPGQVARARKAYHHGNQRLFSGDDAGAIAAYREALRIYPGYVAGYRGLGLAYEEKGDKRQALEALRTYVRTVPNAKDVGLIQKRIEHLERGN